jgi:hypothetical protein
VLVPGLLEPGSLLSGPVDGVLGELGVVGELGELGALGELGLEGELGLVWPPCCSVVCDPPLVWAIAVVPSAIAVAAVSAHSLLRVLMVGLPSPERCASTCMREAGIPTNRALAF